MRRARVEPIFLLLADRSSSIMNPLLYVADPRRSHCHRLLFLCPTILPTLVRDSIRDLHIISGFPHSVNTRTPALYFLEKPHSLATRLSAGRPGQSNRIEPGSKRSDERRKRGIGQQDEHGHHSTLPPWESHESPRQTTRKLGGNGRYVGYESGRKLSLGTQSSAVIPWIQPLTNSTAAGASRDTNELSENLLATCVLTVILASSLYTKKALYEKLLHRVAKSMGLREMGIGFTTDRTSEGIKLTLTTYGLHDTGKRPSEQRPSKFGEIPEDKLTFTFSRSSGAGGQNVNKLSTKVELRFVVSEADWLPSDVRTRLSRQEKGRVNKDGELVVSSQEYRTQAQNRVNVLKKLKSMIEAAWEKPKERKMRTGLSKAGKAMRRAHKEFRSKVKVNRGKVREYD